jgi:uncharacterized protein YndB with AHSA1/START domain
MRHDLVISKSVIINAENSKVWEALTNPEIIKEYLFGTKTVTDWQIGHKISFEGEYQGQVYKDHGYILENIPGEKLSYSYWSAFTELEDKPENYSTIIYSLNNSSNDKTEFTWTQKGFANEDGFKHSTDEMDAFLNQIKEIVER